MANEACDPSPASVNAALTSVSSNSKATANGMATFHTVSYARDVGGMMLNVDNIIPRNNDIIGEERRDPTHVWTSRDFGREGMGKGWERDGMGWEKGGSGGRSFSFVCMLGITRS